MVNLNLIIFIFDHVMGKSFIPLTTSSSKFYCHESSAYFNLGDDIRVKER
jgi:hypothetical protein